MSGNIIEIGTKQKPVYDFLLVFHCNYIIISKKLVSALPDGEHHMILMLLVLTQNQSVTYRQTDRWTCHSSLSDAYAQQMQDKNKSISYET